jgi:hypothetical protein
MMIHRDHAKQMVVSLGNRLARPMAINIANYEVFEVSTERSLVNCHDLHANCRGDDLRATFSANL